MSATGFTPIQLYYSTTAAAAPSAGNLAAGELALNITDGRLFYKDNGGVVRVLATKAGASGDVVGPGSSTDNAMARFDSTTGKLVQNSVGVLDDSGNLTGIAALTTSGALTLNGGTANGVTYLNGSKVLTSGSALTFDGSNLVNGGNFSTNTSGLATYFRASGTAYTQIGDNQTLGAGTAFVIGSSTPYLAGNVGGSEAMRLTSTGLGIGTSSPAVKLHVSGSSATAEIRVQSNSTVPALSFYSDSAVGGTRNWAIASSFNNFGDLVFQQSNALGGNPLTAGTTHMMLDASGNLLLGTTALGLSNTDSALIQTSGATCALILQHSSGNVSGTAYQLYVYNGSIIGSITQSGTTTVAYNTSSDYRLKNITGPITTSGAYIDSLKPVEGTWKADGSTFVGLIAHEAQEVSRTLVATGTKDGEQMQGMDYSSAELIANMLAELKSLRVRVAALESN